VPEVVKADARRPGAVEEFMEDAAQARPAHRASEAVREDEVTRLPGRAGREPRPRLQVPLTLQRLRHRPGQRDRSTGPMRLRLCVGDASTLDRLRCLLDPELPRGEVDILPSAVQAVPRREGPCTTP